MANQGLPGGTPKQARPLDQGRYVGNPNHMAQKGAVLPDMNVGIQDMAMRNPDGSISGGSSFLQNINDNSNSPVKIAPATQPKGLRDANGNLVTNNVSYADGITNNQSMMQMPNRTAPMNINTMAAEGIKAAGAGTIAGMGYQPDQVGVAGTSATVTPQTLAGTNMQPYTNPYDDAVVKANEADILRGAKMGMNTLQGQAQAAGAFGGSRHGVAMGEIGRDTVSQLAQASAGLRQAGFQNAQNMALQDIGNNFQAQLANQQAGMGDISNQLQASLANQQAGLAGAGQRLGAANQLGQIANLGFGMGQQVNNNLMQQGMQQQAMQQALFDAAQKQFQGFTNQPVNSLGYVTAALGNTPVPETQTTTKQNGLFDYLTAATQMYGG